MSHDAHVLLEKVPLDEELALCLAERRESYAHSHGNYLPSLSKSGPTTLCLRRILQADSCLPERRRPKRPPLQGMCARDAGVAAAGKFGETKAAARQIGAAHVQRSV